MGTSSSVMMMIFSASQRVTRRVLHPAGRNGWLPCGREAGTQGGREGGITRTNKPVCERVERCILHQHLHAAREVNDSTQTHASQQFAVEPV
jgi:hypothetical protein